MKPTACPHTTLAWWAGPTEAFLPDSALVEVERRCRRRGHLTGCRNQRNRSITAGLHGGRHWSAGGAVRSSSSVPGGSLPCGMVFSTCASPLGAPWAVSGPKQEPRKIRASPIVQLTAQMLVHCYLQHCCCRRLLIRWIEQAASEVWIAPADPLKPYQRAIELPARKKLLTATLVTRCGEPIHLNAHLPRSGSRKARRGPALNHLCQDWAKTGRPCRACPPSPWHLAAALV